MELVVLQSKGKQMFLGNFITRSSHNSDEVSQTQKSQYLFNKGARYSSMVRAFPHGVMVIRLILHGGPIELFLVPASVTRLV